MCSGNLKNRRKLIADFKLQIQEKIVPRRKRKGEVKY